ncbi:MAG: SAM-dependent methyltransferase [Hyphomonadaceae bacterium]|nr:SAM-dependent methyltransferase [Hyphomonadaceae bacterium]
MPPISASERQIWSALRKLRAEGTHVRRQHPIGRYVIDFAILRSRIAIAMDGPFHSWPQNAEREAARQSYIEDKGWTVLRFPHLTPSDHVLDAVRAAAATIAGKAPPSPSGGGGRGWGESPNDHNAAPNLRRTRAARKLPPRSKKAPSTEHPTAPATPRPLPPPPEGEGKRPSLKTRLIRQISQTGPISVAHYMQAALYDPEHGYYTRADAIGRDFITAPESSQMFGELIGLWCVHEWRAIGAPTPFRLVELGPGSGALIADALRAARLAPDFLAALQLHLIEVSPTLRERQKAALAPLSIDATWTDELPQPGVPALFILNEFLDCFPIRQFVRTQEGWRERQVGLGADGDLAFGLAPALPGGPEAEIGAIREEAPSLRPFIDQLAEHLRAAPSRALIIDYAGDGTGDTLQALKAHQKLAPTAAPGDSDLTAHVDFRALAQWAEGLRIDGPSAQGDFLRALGIEARAAALARAHPALWERIEREMHRLTHPDAMGVLFKTLCLSSPDLPASVGF